MRKSSLLLAVGVVLAACGGDEKGPPKTPAPPTATAPSVPAPTTTGEAPKDPPKTQASAADLQKKTLEGFSAAMNAHDAKKMASFYTEDAKLWMPGPPGMPPTKGREAIAANFQKMFDAFSNFKTGASRVFVASKENVIVVEWAYSAKHSGEMHGIKATEKEVGSAGAEVDWFSPEGLIIEQHVFYDMGTTMNQIGAMKPAQKTRPIPSIPTGMPQIAASTGSPDETKNIDLVKAMNGAFETKKEADFLGPIADNAEYDDMTQAETMKGKAPAKKWFGDATKAFPDSKIKTEQVWAFGDIVVAEATWTGTHKDTFMGIKPTQKKIEVHNLDIFQFKDGKLVKGWTYGNSTEMMGQLGLLPPPPAAKKDAPPTTAPPPAPKK